MVAWNVVRASVRPWWPVNVVRHMCVVCPSVCANEGDVATRSRDSVDVLLRTGCPRGRSCMKYCSAAALARVWPRPLRPTKIACCDWGDGACCEPSRSPRRAGRQDGNGVFRRRTFACSHMRLGRLGLCGVCCDPWCTCIRHPCEYFWRARIKGGRSHGCACSPLRHAHVV